MPTSEVIYNYIALRMVAEQLQHSSYAIDPLYEYEWTTIVTLEISGLCDAIIPDSHASFVKITGEIHK